MITDLEKLLAEIEPEIARLMDRLRTLREREMAIKIWIEEEQRNRGSDFPWKFAKGDHPLKQFDIDGKHAEEAALTEKICVAKNVDIDYAARDAEPVKAAPEQTPRPRPAAAQVTAPAAAPKLKDIDSLPGGPKFSIPRFVHLAKDDDEQGNQCRPTSRPSAHEVTVARTMGHRVVPTRDTESESESTRGQILKILREWNAPLTVNQVYLNGMFADKTQVAAEMSQMTLKKGWLNRVEVPNPDPKTKKFSKPMVYAYTIRADAQIPETV